ncbi:MAG: transporter substrate-binding domain-containing protein [Pseudomonadota bacterium]
MADLQASMAALANLLPAADAEVVTALAPQGVLRAGINLSNFLLVTGEDAGGAPQGVSPSMADVLAQQLGCDVQYVTYPSPGGVADAAQEEAWDIGNIGADPARAAFITFTDAYCEIESTCLLPPGSPIGAFADVDQPGIRIASKSRAAYTLWLERNLKHAELVLYDSIDDSYDGFVDNQLDVLAGLRPRLLEDHARLAGSTILADKFAAVQQAIGTPSSRGAAGAAYLQAFVDAAKQSGLVQALIDQHGVTGKLSVAD